MPTRIPGLDASFLRRIVPLRTSTAQRRKRSGGRLQRLQRKCSGVFAVWARDFLRLARYTSVRLALTESEIVAPIARRVGAKGE